MPGCLYLAARIPPFLGDVLIYGGHGEFFLDFLSLLALRKLYSCLSYTDQPNLGVFQRFRSFGLESLQLWWTQHFGLTVSSSGIGNTTRNLWVTASHLSTFLITGVLSVILEANNLLLNSHKYLLAEIWNHSGSDSQAMLGWF